jgi:hypothetical protein
MASRKVVWQDAETEFTSRSSVNEVFGPSGTGRTWLALSAPPPIYYVQFLEKFDGVVQRFQEQYKEQYGQYKEIKTVNCGKSYHGDPSDIQAEAWENLEFFEAVYQDAYFGGKARSVVIDTWPEAWLLYRLGHFGAEKPIKGEAGIKKLNTQQNWGPVNMQWHSLLNAAREASTDHGITTIFVGQVEDEWKESSDGFGKRTGRQIRLSSSAGDKLFLKCDVSIQTSKRELDSGGSEFISTVYKGWFRADEVEGMTFMREKNKLSRILGEITETPWKEWDK